MVKIIFEEQNKVKKNEKNGGQSETSDNIKCTNIQIIGVPEEE